MNDEIKYGYNVFVPADAPDDYKKHAKEKLIDKTILQFRDGFLSEGGMSLSIKIEERSDDFVELDDVGFYDKGTVYSATAYASKVKVIHETTLHLDAIQHDYRYVKLSDVIKHKFSEWVKGLKR